MSRRKVNALLAINLFDCPTCGAPKRGLCRKLGEKDGFFIRRPHKARLEAAKNEIRGSAIA